MPSPTPATPATRWRPTRRSATACRLRFRPSSQNSCSRAGATTGEPITLFPCELISANGEVLRRLCEGIAARSEAPPAFLAWMREDCVWANSLVDRIVSEAIEPVGAVAEPYALWAIERQDRLVVPCRHKAIHVVDDLKTTERLKLFILNLGHTCLAERWLADRRAPEETVKEMLADPAMRAYLDAIYDDEVLARLRGGGDRRGAGLPGQRDRALPQSVPEAPACRDRLEPSGQEGAAARRHHADGCRSRARSRAAAPLGDAPIRPRRRASRDPGVGAAALTIRKPSQRTPPADQIAFRKNFTG